MDVVWNDVTDAAADARFAILGSGLTANRVDPYLHWAALTGFRDLGGPRTWFAVLIELKDGATAADFANGLWGRMPAPDNWRTWLQVPRWYATPSAGLATTRFCTARVAPPFFTELADPASVLAAVVERFVFGWSVDSEVTPGGTSSDPGTLRAWSVGDPVTVGIIDDGIAFAHRRFRDAAGRSRIVHLWDQREPHGERLVSAAPWPVAGEAVPYGFEFDREGPNGLDARLDAASTACRPENAPIAAGLLDEDRLYRDTIGWNAARRVRHGTHVLDLAAGESPRAPDDSARIVAVQLPRAVTLDTAGHLLAPHVTDGLRYLFDRAEAIGGAVGGATVPVVANLSYGTIGGPHDGSSLLERAMDEMIAARRAAGHPTAVVIPAGNHLQWRCHAQLDLAPGGVALLQWRVPPDQPVPAFMEIWLPHLDPALDGDETPVTVRVAPPGDAATVSGEVRRGHSAQCLDAQPRAGASVAERVVATIAFRRAGSTLLDPSHASFYCDRDMILVTIAPTRREGGLRSAAPGGLWRIEIARPAPPVAAPLGRSWPIDAWIQRSDTPVGFSRRVVQSRFEDAAYQVFDRYSGRLLERDPAPSTARRTGTLNAIATGEHPIVVGAARADKRRPSTYTSAGPASPKAGAAQPVRDGPDVAAIADDGAVHGGRLAAATRSAGAAALSGSSVAAPVVSRAVAQLMSRGIDVERSTLVGRVEKSGAPEPGREGAGILPGLPDGRIDRFGG
jgi:hypothetical protein